MSEETRVTELVGRSTASAVLIPVLSPLWDVMLGDLAPAGLVPVGYLPLCGMPGSLSWATLGLSTGVRCVLFHLAVCRGCTSW